MKTMNSWIQSKLNSIKKNYLKMFIKIFWNTPLSKSCKIVPNQIHHQNCCSNSCVAPKSCTLCPERKKVAPTTINYNNQKTATKCNQLSHMTFGWPKKVYKVEILQPNFRKSWRSNLRNTCVDFWNKHLKHHSEVLVPLVQHIQLF